jgi:hypothetical protein
MMWIAFLALLAQQQSESGITHSFLATGSETFIVSGEDKIVWTYPRSTRDGWVLPDGNLLLAVNKGKDFPGGAVVEIGRDGKTRFEFKGTQSEVDTVQPLANGAILLTESGAKPRLLEIDREGKTLVEIPLQCQTKNAHMETRMARKLANGNYLVPHLLDKVVREYRPDGSVASATKTPDDPKESWPFTAIRLDQGRTLVTCTHGNMAIEIDADGKIAWQVANGDLPSPLFSDPCGAQRLPNGNTVICSYGASGAGKVKLFEVTREKKVVWTWTSGKAHGIHTAHVFETNGKAIDGTPMK